MINHFADEHTVVLCTVALLPLKPHCFFKTDWSTLTSVFVARATIITLTITITAAYKRYPPSPDLCHHPPHPSIMALLPRHPPSLTTNCVT